MAGPERGKRITPDGVLVLQNFFDNVSANPTIAQRKDLLRKIQSLPGNEAFNLEKLRDWYKRRRKAGRAAVSLSAGAEAHLRTLLVEMPNPSKSLMIVWAKLLRTDFDLLHRYVLQFHGSYFPSPEPSSPEPSPLPVSNSTPENHPLPSATSKQRHPSRAPKPYLPAHPQTSLEQASLKIAHPSAGQAHKLALIQEIGQRLEDKFVVRKGAPSPLAVDSFTSLTAPYMSKMQTFLSKVESGDFLKEGWDPSMSSSRDYKHNSTTPIMHNLLHAPARPSSPPVYMMRCPSSENLLDSGKPPAYSATILAMTAQGDNTHSTSHFHCQTPSIVVQPPSPMLAASFEGIASPFVSPPPSGFDPVASMHLEWDCGDDEGWVPRSEASMPDSLSTGPPLSVHEGHLHSNVHVNQTRIRSHSFEHGPVLTRSMESSGCTIIGVGTVQKGRGQGCDIDMLHARMVALDIGVRR